MLEAVRSRFDSRVIVIAAMLSLGACGEGVLDPPPEQPGAPEPPFPVNASAIAFVSDRDGTPHIYLSDAAGKNVVRLAEGRSPAWSRDGRQIAFVRGSDRGDNSQIWVMRADGSDQRYVTQGFAPTWAPDGRIVFHTYIWNPAEGGIMVVNADGTGRKLLLPHTWALQFAYPGNLASVQFPTWSPDGESIAFWFYGGYYSHMAVGIMKSDGSEARDLQADRTYSSTWGRVQWSPDGSFLTTTFANMAIISVEKTGFVLEHYRNPGRLLFEPDWSPDGRQLVFSEGGYGADRRRRIFVLNLLTNDVRQLIPEASDPVFPGYSDTEPTWARAVPTDAGS